MSILKKIRKSYDVGSGLFNARPVETETFCDKMYSGYCSQFSNMSYLKKVEWILRVNLAAKKMLLSAIFYTQTVYIEEHRLINLQYYSAYYSLFNAFSANIIMTPYIDLEVALKVSHSRAFAEIENYFVKYNMFDNAVIKLFNGLRLTRELYSYHLPLGVNMDKDYPNLEKGTQLTKLEEVFPESLQMSDLLSFLAYYAWEKKGVSFLDEYEQYEQEVNDLFFSFIEFKDFKGQYCIIGNDDYRRQARMLHTNSSPLPIGWFITEKTCEDLECDWIDEPDGEYYSFTEARKYLTSVLDSVI